MGFEWIEAGSEAVERFGYDGDACELHVMFAGGRHYAYGPVPENVFVDLLTAGSVGRFVNAKIKPYFASREVEPPAPGPAGGPADRRPDRQRQVRPGDATRR